VTDGVTLGHTCCHAPYCQNELSSVKDRYCETHRALESQCIISGCYEPCESPNLTCSTPEHRQQEHDK
ncbi:hypothetical protein BDZ89DRAFT_930132, partial [Hymenopellis radicata]